MKKVLHIAYDTLPGAGSVPILFHEEMKKRGIFSKLLVHGRNAKKEDDIIVYHNLLSITIHKLGLGFNKVFKRYGRSKYFFLNLNEKHNYISSESILRKVNFKPDVIILYWTSRFINTKTIAELYRRTKADVYWIMTDMGAYTGGCHHSWGCDNFKKDCNNCPAIKSNYRAAQNLQLKKEHLNGVPLTLISSEGDSYKYTNNSSLFQNQEKKTHFLKVNRNSALSDITKVQARKRLGLEIADIIFFIGATNFKDERKGMKLLMETIQILSETLDPLIKDRICFVYSSKNGSKDFEGIPFRTISLGYMDFNDELPLAFIASDAHISSSIMDTGPYMVNLSIAYGCPVLSFGIGVAINLVVNGINGFKADEISANSLADAIVSFLNLYIKEIYMHENCITLAKEKLYWNDSSLKMFGLE